MAAWRSVGWTTTTFGRASQPSTTSRASSTDSGDATICGLVVRRRNARATGQARATVSVPPTSPSTHGRACGKRGEVSSIA